MESSNSFNTRIVQNFHLVWLNESINETNNKYHDFITKLRQVVNTVNLFDNIDLCIDFITDAEETAFVIISGELNQTFIPILLDITQITCVYIFCADNFEQDKWQKKSFKVSGIHTDIDSICEALKQAVQDYDHNALPISIIKQVDGTANQNLDELNPSFMYTQMLKDILLTLDFNQEHFKDFIGYCREHFATNTIELRNVDRIEREYDDQHAIRWYTYQCFLYSMLNKALRTMEAKLIINMGFFIRDLHKHITTLHFEQYIQQSHPDSFIVYRGQGLSQIDFNQLKEAPGGLLAFNNFLSTSRNRQVSLRFARRILNQSDIVGVLFVMKIDPSMSTTSFANVKDASYYTTEDEVLFSMHSVFRIGLVEKIENSDRLWQVNLTLSNDNDPQLQVLMESIESDIVGPTGWFQLGSLMMRVAQFDQAEQIYGVVINQTTDEMAKGNIYHQLGSIKYRQGKFPESITYYEKALVIRQKTLPTNHPELAAAYNNIGAVYDGMGEYQKALSYYQKDIKISQQIIPVRYRSLATSYNNIGGVLDKMGQYSDALPYFQKGLEI